MAKRNPRRFPGLCLLLYCGVGFQDDMAARILMQSGIDHGFHLFGGALTFSRIYPTIQSTGKARYPFATHAEDHMAEQAFGV